MSLRDEIFSTTFFKIFSRFHTFKIIKIKLSKFRIESKGGMPLTKQQMLMLRNEK